MMTCGKCVKYVEVIVNVWRNKHPVDVYRLIFDFASLCPTITQLCICPRNTLKIHGRVL